MPQNKQMPAQVPEARAATSQSHRANRVREMFAARATRRLPGREQDRERLMRSRKAASCGYLSGSDRAKKLHRKIRWSIRSAKWRKTTLRKRIAESPKDEAKRRFRSGRKSR